MGFCVGCGGTKIENRDTCKCATCNKMDRASPVTVKDRKPIKQVSDKRAKKLTVRAKAYDQVRKEQTRCACCGTTHFLTPSHVLPQKHFSGLASNPRNIVVLCQTDHMLWEHEKERFKLMFPDVWSLKMQIMQELAPQEFERFKIKHGNIFT